MQDEKKWLRKWLRKKVNKEFSEVKLGILINVPNVKDYSEVETKFNLIISFIQNQFPEAVMSELDKRKLKSQKLVN